MVFCVLLGTARLCAVKRVGFYCILSLRCENNIATRSSMRTAQLPEPNMHVLNISNKIPLRQQSAGKQIPVQPKTRLWPQNRGRTRTATAACGNRRAHCTVHCPAFCCCTAVQHFWDTRTTFSRRHEPYINLQTHQPANILTYKHINLQASRFCDYVGYVPTNCTFLADSSSCDFSRLRDHHRLLLNGTFISLF